MTLEFDADKVTSADILGLETVEGFSFKPVIRDFLDRTRKHIGKSLENQKNAVGEGLEGFGDEWRKIKQRVSPQLADVKGRFSDAMLSSLTDINTIKITGRLSGNYGPVNKPKRGGFAKYGGDSLSYIHWYDKEKAHGKLMHWSKKDLDTFEDEVADLIIGAMST